MQKLYAILFLLVMVMATEPGPQLLRLPVLFSHFQTHLTQQRSESFLGFLQEHYLFHHGSDADSQQDDQLPFKSVQAEGFSLVFLPVRYISLQADRTPLLRRAPMPQHFTLQELRQGIFHPPRNC